MTQLLRETPTLEPALTDEPPVHDARLAATCAHPSANLYSATTQPTQRYVLTRFL